MNLKQKNINRNTIKEYIVYPIILLFTISLILTFIVDSISRGSMSLSINFIKNSFLTFLFNFMIIFLTLSITLLTRKKMFSFSFLSIFWIILAIINNVLVDLRGTPFTGNDLKLIDSAFKVVDSYLSKGQIKGIILAISIIIILLILIFIFAPKSKYKINYLISLSMIMIIIIISKFTTILALNNSIISNNFWDISATYDENGFIYCFSTTLVNNGIKEPSSYSESELESIVYSLTDTLYANNLTTVNESLSSYTQDDNHPNIIMVQLESFFDPKLIKGVEYSIDPISNFRTLQENYSTGTFSVSTIGGGTANTEFEVLTGLNLDFFAAGEYPYNNVLLNNTSESICYELKELNYSTHSIHNNEGTFYNRNKVFSNLGFDTYTPAEYMLINERTPIGWAKDQVLIQSILDCLNSTENKDFIYTISVQGHGSYPNEELDYDKHVTITNIENTEIKIPLEYYVNQVYEMDIFVSDLIKAVNEIDEDTIIVFYGDHLPNFNLSKEDLYNNNLYETEYVIWNNFNLEKSNLDVEAYQLTSRILSDIGVDNGLINKLHQSYLFEDQDSPYKDYDTYLDTLKNLEYDIYYGDSYIYKYLDRPLPTDLKFGANDIVLSNIYIDNDKLVAEGENFTYNSVFLIDGNFVYADFESPNRITCDSSNIKNEGSNIFIGQISSGAQLLSTTQTVTVIP